MPGRFRWQLLVAGVGLSIVLALLASMTFTSATQIVPTDGGSYTEAIVGHPKYVNPILSQFNDVDDDLASLLFEGLTRLTPTGEIAPALAREWTISPDGLTYTFNLRDDVTWHDGVPFTADDVVFTIQTIQSPDYPGSPNVRDLWQDVTVRKVDDHTVEFVLQAPFAPFLEYSTQGLIPKHLLEGVPPTALTGHSFNARPVGTGSLRLVTASAREFVLEPNTDYYGPRPYLQRITFRFFSSTDEAFNALQRGDVDGIRYVPPDRLDSLAGARFQVTSRPEQSKLTLLLLNTQDPILSDVAVRQAIQAAIDRPRIIEKALAGQGTPAYSPIPPASWAHNPEVSTSGDYQPDRARALLDQAGWKLTTNDGVREKDGTKLRIVLLTNDRPERIAAAEELSRQLSLVGISVDLQSAGWTGVVQDFLVPRRFQAVLTEQWSPTTDPDAYQFWHSSQITGGLNFSSWSNRTADTLLEEGRREGQREKRADRYREFQEIFATEVPAIPLYYPHYTYAVSRQVHGIELGLMLHPADRFATINNWYVLTKRVPRQE